MPINQITWSIDTAAQQQNPMRFESMQGEDITISVNVLTAGIAANLAGATAKLYWQAGNVTQDWYSVDATIVDNVVSVDWTHDLDTGKAKYIFYFRVEKSEEITYRAYGVMSMIATPGFVPNELDLPVSVLDFDEVELINSPYALSSDFANHTVDQNAHADIRGLIDGYISANDLLIADLSSDFSNHTVDTNAHADIRGLISDVYSTVGDIGSILDAINGEVI